MHQNMHQKSQTSSFFFHFLVLNINAFILKLANFFNTHASAEGASGDFLNQKQ